MANSPAHKLGQIIGDALEETIQPFLAEFADKHSLFLDKKGSRSVRSGTKVTWTDKFANAHDLDFVLERGGSEERRGVPLGFVETAWRRYTKHSRNKAQEIQGAIIPLRDTHLDMCPFIGVVLAGEFTEASLVQLRSLGFAVVYFPYETVVAAFLKAGVDVSYEESTPAKDLQAKVRAWEKSSGNKKKAVYKELALKNQYELMTFIQKIADVVNRRIKTIRVTPMYGASTERVSVVDAIAFIQQLDDETTGAKLLQIEVQVRFANGDKIDAVYSSKDVATAFLKTLQVAPNNEGSEIVKETISSEL